MANPSPPSIDRVIVQAERAGDLLARLRAANVAVPGRASGRTSDHVETYSAIRLLASRGHALTDFPLRLIKRERPDFLLTLNGKEIGIEHTEAISQNDAKEAALRDSGIGPDAYFIRPAALGEPVKSSKQLEAEILADEMGPGWYGDSVERGWVDAMIYFIRKKMSASRQLDFSRFASNWLLIYDQWPAPALNVSQAMPLLREALSALDPWGTFDHIYILDESLLIEIRADSTRLYCVNHCQ